MCVRNKVEGCVVKVQGKKQNIFKFEYKVGDVHHLINDVCRNAFRYVHRFHLLQASYLMFESLLLGWPIELEKIF